MPHNEEYWKEMKIGHIMMNEPGKPGEWCEDDCIVGFYDENGRLVVVGEHGSDEDFGRYSEAIMNGDGYYDSNGKFIRYPD